MMGRQTVDQSQLFYLFNLEGRIPVRHLLRRINPIITRILAELRDKLEPFYSEIGQPSIDPELMIRMLIVAYCYGIRSERKLCEEVNLHLAYRWFCRLDLDDKVPDHSTFSVNRHGRFRESDIFRQVFEAVVTRFACAGVAAYSLAWARLSRSFCISPNCSRSLVLLSASRKDFTKISALSENCVNKRASTKPSSRLDCAKSTAAVNLLLLGRICRSGRCNSGGLGDQPSLQTEDRFLSRLYVVHFL